ncbi:hypothetical protein SGM_6807 [Streptomyces griseoaurantiacus M045]|uniref:Uncharacterized protein n=1 Tax=Streptomyces griseoaurantiacus M045 TaxID=996637 RepID=F3NCB8_9ACTN|nr:hypothetical protein SGM_6807 [Streptomyces griseoaurantiacus M045]
MGRSRGSERGRPPRVGHSSGMDDTRCETRYIALLCVPRRRRRSAGRPACSAPRSSPPREKHYRSRSTSGRVGGPGKANVKRHRQQSSPQRRGELICQAPSMPKGWSRPSAT